MTATVIKLARSAAAHAVEQGRDVDAYAFTECADALESQAAELDRLRNAARSRLKCPEGHRPGESRGACWFCDAEANYVDVENIKELCDHAGFPRGDVAARVEQLIADLAALRAKPGEETIIDDDYECRHGTTGRMIIFTSCYWCRGGK